MVILCGTIHNEPDERASFMSSFGKESYTVTTLMKYYSGIVSKRKMTTTVIVEDC